MSRGIREWAEFYLQAAAEVATEQRQIGKRTKLLWKKLPTRSGSLVVMSEMHGHVYQALVAHTAHPDYEADWIESDASLDQLSRQCYWSARSVDSLLADLRAVGLIRSKRRHNRSNITRIFRTAGNFSSPVTDVEGDGNGKQPGIGRKSQAADEGDLSQEADDPIAIELCDAKQEVDEELAPDLVSRLASALKAADCHVSGESEDYAERVACYLNQATSRDLFGETRGAQLALSVGDVSTTVAVLEALLPAHLTVATWYGNWCILRKPEFYARALLREACGREVRFGGFSAEVKAHRALPVLLAVFMRKDSMGYEDAYAGIARADNPAAYLQRIVVGLLKKHDDDYAAWSATTVEADEIDDNDEF